MLILLLSKLGQLTSASVNPSVSGHGRYRAGLGMYYF